MQELPTADQIRERISESKPEENRYCLMTLYLLAARISEVVGKASPSDQTTPRIQTTNDVRTDVFMMMNGIEETAIIFTVRTAKRGGFVRSIALPKNYEDWASQLYEYYQKKNGVVFPFTRQKASMMAKGVFEGYIYPIEKYGMGNKDFVPRHFRDFSLHALRHVRATELVEFYGFNTNELMNYCGWTQSAAGFSNVVDRYVSLNWQSYFPKLLKQR